MNLKTSKKSLIFGILTGLTTLLLSEIYLSTKMKYLSVPIGIICNGLAFMFLHLIQNRGIAIINRDYKRKHTPKNMEAYVERIFRNNFKNNTYSAQNI